MHHNDTPRTTEQNARERIDGILRSIEIEVWPEEGDIWLGDTNPAIDQLIGFIREAMLSPEAVQAAYHEASVEMFTPAGANLFDITGILSNPGAVISAALDAAFGPEDGGDVKAGK